MRFVPDKHRRAVAKELKPIYTAVDADAAAEALEAFEADWGERYPMIGKTWRDAWEHVTPFLAFPTDVRRVIYTTNTIEAKRNGDRPTTGAQHCFHSKSTSETDCPDTQKVGHPRPSMLTTRADLIRCSSCV